MHPQRINKLILGKINPHAKYVLYWMQQAQRVDYNHALLHAIREANAHNLPVLVCFVLNTNYPDANRNHYEFMLEGLRQVEDDLLARKINFVIKVGEAEDVIFPLLEEALILVMDYGYLKPQNKWRRALYNKMIKHNVAVNLAVIESDVLVPAHLAYPKAAYTAAILKRSIDKQFNEFLDFTNLDPILNGTLVKVTTDLNIENISEALSNINLDQNTLKTKIFIGGRQAALDHLNKFINHKLKRYDQRSDPSLEIQSYLSPYLHFGQISVQEIINIVKKSKNITPEIISAFIDQLVVRRELAINFVFYHKDYDNFDAIFEPWTYRTINNHQNDLRDYLYSVEELEEGLTHDPYFNAAMKEMFTTGFMANYMRMYWAKKIMEWMPSMKEAYQTIIYLNNKYFIDGRDANSYLNIAWCFGKTDRAWQERSVFGTIRYMNAAGLKRKFDIEKYVQMIETL